MKRGYVPLIVFLCTLLALFLLLISSSPAVAVSDDTCLDPLGDIPLQNGVSVPADEAAVTGIEEYDKSTQSLTITYHDLSQDDDFWIDISTRHVDRGLHVTNATGFENHSDDISYSYRWDESTERPSISLVTTHPEPEEFESFAYTANPSWAFLPVPSHAPATHISFNGQGFVGDQFILAGPSTVYTESAGCQEIRIIVPEAANLSESPEAIVESVATAAEQLEVGPKYSYVNGYALPDPMYRGGAAEVHEYWAQESSTLSIGDGFRGGVIPANTWLHEYSHTRQQFLHNHSVRPAEDMRWFTEASATYYSVELTVRQGKAGPCDYTYYFRDMSLYRMNGVILSDQTTWGDHNQGDYRKGAVVLSALDMQIRDKTNGQRTLDDVFYRMNTFEGTVTYAEFKRIVEDVAGSPLDDWLDERITTDQHFEPGDRETACQWEMVQHELVHTNEGRIFVGVLGLVLVAGAYAIYRRVQERE